jgi:hypothetical protein
VAQGIKEMTPAMHGTAGAHLSGRWLSGLIWLFFSLVVMAENSAHLDILPSDADDLQTDAIYNSATGWRTPAAYENEWRRGAARPAGRIQFGYDSAYEQMRASGNNHDLDSGLGGVDHPQNTQLRISF